MGLAAPGTCSCASSRASTSLLAGPCILPGLLAHLLETHRPGLPWGSLGSFGPLGPQKSCPGRLAKLCFWLSVQPALLGRYALRASGGPDAVPRVEFRLPCTGRPTVQRPGQAPQHETQSLLERLHRATETSGCMLLRARVGIETIASEEVSGRELERERASWCRLPTSTDPIPPAHTHQFMRGRRWCNVVNGKERTHTHHTHSHTHSHYGRPYNLDSQGSPVGYYPA